MNATHIICVTLEPAYKMERMLHRSGLARSARSYRETADRKMMVIGDLVDLGSWSHGVVHVKNWRPRAGYQIKRDDLDTQVAIDSCLSEVICVQSHRTGLANLVNMVDIKLLSPRSVRHAHRPAQVHRARLTQLTGAGGVPMAQRSAANLKFTLSIYLMECKFLDRRLPRGLFYILNNRQLLARLQAIGISKADLQAVLVMQLH